MLEKILLMKASQSGTERAMSFISDIVKGRFENIYRSGKTTKDEIDMVNVLTVIGQNRNIRNFNKKKLLISICQKRKTILLYLNLEEKSH